MSTLKKQKDRGLYPISTVAELTGMNPITLRAWESRYGLIMPSRTESGRRLYTQADIDNIKTLQGILEQGIPISQAATVLKQNASIDLVPMQTRDSWHHYIRLMLSAVSLYDEHILDEVYTEAVSLYPIEVVTENLLIPMLEILGDRWNKAPGGIAEEHFLSMYLRNKLGARLHHQARNTTGKPFVVAGLPGERHEFGLLLFSLSMMNHGQRIILLGTDLPLDEVLTVADKTHPRAVVLSGSSIANVGKTKKALRVFSQKCAFPIIVGGSATVKHEELFESCGMTVIGDDISRSVDYITQTFYK